MNKIRKYRQTFEGPEHKIIERLLKNTVKLKEELLELLQERIVENFRAAGNGPVK